LVDNLTIVINHLQTFILKSTVRLDTGLGTNYLDETLLVRPPFVCCGFLLSEPKLTPKNNK